MYCISSEQLIAGLIVVTLITIIFGLYKLGTFINVALILWYASRYLVTCDPLTKPMMYAPDNSAANEKTEL